MKAYTLEKGVWEYLMEKRESLTLDLVVHFEKQKYTKQGVYRVLRLFEKEGRVIRLRNYVAINLMWVQSEIERLSTLVVRPELFFESFETKHVYRVKTLDELDRLYGQLFVTLLSSHVKTLPVALFYDLHNYTYIHKIPIVDWYIDFIYKKAPKICLLIGSKSPLDSVLAKKMKRISVYQTEKRWPYFISVLGNYVIYNHVDKKVWGRIDHVFMNTDIDKARNELLFLSQLKGNYKIVVEKDSTRAEYFRKYFAKYFVLPH